LPEEGWINKPEDVERPRARSTDGTGLVLDTYTAFADDCRRW